MCHLRNQSKTISNIFLQEGDAVDAESDKDETVTALLDEQSGEELLCAQYLHVR